MAVQFRVLGSLEISGGVRAAELRPRERRLLALLLLEANRPVPIETLVTQLWHLDTPDHPRQALQVCVSRLRKATGGSSEVRVDMPGPAAYRLVVPCEEVDAAQFRTALAAATTAHDPDAKRTLLKRALDLWRGRPLEGLISEDEHERITGRWEERWIDAVEEYLALALLVGEDVELVRDLPALVERYPFRPQLVHSLMTSLSAQGREPEALEAFRRHRDRLVAETGLEPHASLIQVQERILAGAESVPPPSLRPPATVPRQLVADVPLLVGRDDELEWVRTVRAERRPTGAPVVLAFHGPPGVGKTALATRVGHAICADHPGGTLMVNLRAGSGTPLQPQDVLAHLLRGLGHDDRSIPADVEARAGLFRSATASARVLVVLDDAASTAQVRPLLPASSGCTVVLTSRLPLLGLESARHLGVRRLSDADATVLLRARAGREHEDAPEIEGLAHWSAGLPLTLHIIASRMATRDFDLDRVHRLLIDGQDRIDWLTAGDLAMRDSLKSALRGCTDSAVWAFAHLGAVRRSVSPPVAAALAGTSVPAAAAVLEELSDMGLVSRQSGPSRDRYSMHDLVADHAGEHWENLSAPDRETAIRRSLAHASAACEAALDDPEPDPIFDCDGDLWADLVRDHSGVDPTAGARLALGLDAHLLRRGRPEERARILTWALVPGGHDSEPAWLAKLHLARFAAWAGLDHHPAELRTEAHHALLAATVAADPALVQAARAKLGFAAHLDGDLSSADQIFRTILAEPSTGDGDAGVRQMATNNLAAITTDLGRPSDAVTILQAELDKPIQGHERARAISLKCLAEAALASGDTATAADALTGMRAIVQQLGDQLGDAYCDIIGVQLEVQQGRPELALVQSRRARRTLTEMGDATGLAALDRADAAVFALTGQLAEAEDRLRRATIQATTIGSRLEVARTQQCAERLGIAIN